MEKYVAALISNRPFGGGDNYIHDGSATLALQRGDSCYLIATGHQVTALQAARQTWAFLPSLGALEPVTVIAKAQLADVAILEFKSTSALETIEMALTVPVWTFSLENEVTVYGFPKFNTPESDMNAAISRLELRKTMARIKGVTYENFPEGPGLLVLLDAQLRNGESGGLAFATDLGPIGINQGSRLLSPDGGVW